MKSIISSLVLASAVAACAPQNVGLTQVGWNQETDSFAQPLLGNALMVSCSSGNDGCQKRIAAFCPNGHSVIQKINQSENKLTYRLKCEDA